MDFPRAAAGTVNLLTVLFASLRLSGRARSLLNSNVSLPLLSVLTGRGGYSLGGSAGAGSWKWWPEASVTGIRAYQNSSSTNSGRAGGGAATVAETSPGPESGIKAASSPGEALGSRRVIIQHGGGVRLNFFFYHQSIFVPLIFFPFPSGYRTLSKEGLKLTLAMRQ